MVAQGSLDDFHNRTGTVVHPAYAPAEFLRLHHEEPDRVARVAKWQSISSYLLTKWMLAGERGPLPMSFSEASWTGLLDFRRCEWDDRLLALVGMDVHKMPTLQDSSVPVSGLRAAYAAEWPELANVPFFLGIGDGAAANIGSKCIDASRIAVTVGTSAAIRVVLRDETMKDRKVPKGLWCYRIGKDRVMLGGALNDGGSVYQFFRETLQLSPQGACSGLAS
jgi:gluconokinase